MVIWCIKLVLIFVEIFIIKTGLVTKQIFTVDTLIYWVSDHWWRPIFSCEAVESNTNKLFAFSAWRLCSVTPYSLPLNDLHRIKKWTMRWVFLEVCISHTWMFVFNFICTIYDMLHQVHVLVTAMSVDLSSFVWSFDFLSLHMPMHNSWLGTGSWLNLLNANKYIIKYFTLEVKKKRCHVKLFSYFYICCHI